MVVKRGTNDAEIVPMARHFKGSGTVLRFIEYMDVGASNGWNMSEVLPSADVVARIAEHFPLRPLEAHNDAETAQRWGYAGRQRRDRRHFERDARVLQFLHARPPLDRRQAVPVPVRHVRPRLARADPQRRERRHCRHRHRPDLGSAHRPLLATSRQQRVARCRPGRPRVEMSYIGG